MNRTEQREQIFMLLFRVEFNRKSDMEEQCTLFFEEAETEISEKDQNYIRSKYEKIAERLPEIDRLINETAKGWDTQRMGKVELAIIRLAVYEIKFDESVPTGVAINEAVELAKAKKEIQEKDAEIDREGKIAGVFCKAYEKAVLLDPTEENVRIWAKCTRMTRDEMEDTVKESRELAEVFRTIADLMERFLPDRGTL